MSPVWLEPERACRSANGKPSPHRGRGRRPPGLSTSLSTRSSPTTRPALPDPEHPMPTPYDPCPWIEFPHDYAKPNPPPPEEVPPPPPAQAQAPAPVLAQSPSPPPPDLAAEAIAALPPLLKHKEVLALMRVRMAVLRHLWLTGRFPRPVVLNSRLYRWPKAEVLAALRLLDQDPGWRPKPRPRPEPRLPPLEPKPKPKPKRR